MGFNIDVWSDQTDDNHECNHFINRTFYNFVNSGDRVGDQSILIQSGRYYGLDLSPLQNLVYTWDEVTDEYIQENIQNLDTLLELVTRFRNGIAQDRTVCDKISYAWHEDMGILENNENLIQDVSTVTTKQLLDWLQQEPKKAGENSNPWKPYFDEGQILEDLDNLLASLHCYKSRGVTEVYLTAG
jgi:predicted DsbA family dithiol-disulfide isomerase